jgi:uncharacterized membrane protein YgaE (UPF0421/DUF939 family)
MSGGGRPMTTMIPQTQKVIEETKVVAVQEEEDEDDEGNLDREVERRRMIRSQSMINKQVLQLQRQMEIFDKNEQTSGLSLNDFRKL